MKRMIAIGLFVNAVLLAGILLKEKDAVVHAEGGGGAPVVNGDVNGDGAIDISDTVYLLTSLYLGGPDPKAIECPSPAGMGLPAMGQTKCYDTNGSEITCGNANYPGQDGGSGPCRAERTIDHLILDQTERLRKVLVTYAPDGSLCEIPGCPGSCSWRRRGDHFSLC